ncbi:CLUMA_CG001147, isoform A [Clunio marinus]|uniref:CLUMA_CG001147, isoform A n=1 Tax=Clunio marinus TaxID=568069 RepID=A0A1J1HM91_9DIPT|nr:CLUMA_CG001147, isoform A [Clunio marinus]
MAEFKEEMKEKFIDLKTKSELCDSSENLCIAVNRIGLLFKGFFVVAIDHCPENAFKKVNSEISMNNFSLDRVVLSLPGKAVKTSRVRINEIQEKIQEKIKTYGEKVEIKSCREENFPMKETTWESRTSTTTKHKQQTANDCQAKDIFQNLVSLEVQTEYFITAITSLNHA